MSESIEEMEKELAQLGREVRRYIYIALGFIAVSALCAGFNIAYLIFLR